MGGGGHHGGHHGHDGGRAVCHHIFALRHWARLMLEASVVCFAHLKLSVHVLAHLLGGGGGGG